MAETTSTKESEIAVKIKAFILLIWKLLTDTENQWKELSKESVSDKDFYRNYIVPLVAIGPIAAFIGFAYVGVPGYSQLPLLYCFLQSSISFIFMLASVYMMAVLISTVTYVTGNYDDDSEALKVSAYSYTPYWLASILYINPVFTPVVIVLSFYGLFIAFFGLKTVMKCPQWLAGTALPLIFIFALAFGMTPYLLTKNLYHIYIGKIHPEQTSEPVKVQPQVVQPVQRKPSNVIVPGIEPYDPSERGTPVEEAPPLKKR